MGSQRVQCCSYTRFEFNINCVWNADPADAVGQVGSSSWVLDERIFSYEDCWHESSFLTALILQLNIRGLSKNIPESFLSFRCFAVAYKANLDFSVTYVRVSRSPRSSMYWISLIRFLPRDIEHRFTLSPIKHYALVPAAISILEFCSSSPHCSQVVKEGSSPNPHGHERKI